MRTILAWQLFLSATGVSSRPGNNLFFRSRFCRSGDDYVCRKRLSIKSYNVHFVRDGEDCLELCTPIPGLLRILGWQCGKCPTCSERAFEDREELITAVDAYIAAGTQAAESEVAKKYGYPMSSWCVTKITDFSKLFDGIRDNRIAADFSEDLNDWDVSNAVDMSFMFVDSSFSGNISSWNTSKVETMQGMFEGSEFNHNISNWDTRSLVDAANMFDGAFLFNSDISKWKTSKVQDMSSMFVDADAFNIDLSGWDVSSVTDFSDQFSEADLFAQDLCAWKDDMTDITAPGKVFGMFSGTSCPVKTNPEVPDPIDSLCFDCSGSDSNF